MPSLDESIRCVWCLHEPRKPGSRFCCANHERDYRAASKRANDKRRGTVNATQAKISIYNRLEVAQRVLYEPDTPHRLNMPQIVTVWNVKTGQVKKVMV